MCSVNSFTQKAFKLTQPEADHHMGTMSPPLYKKLVGSLMFQIIEKKQESSLFLLSYLKTLSTGPDGNWTCDLRLCKPEIIELNLQGRGIPFAEYGHLYEPLRYCVNYKVFLLFIYWIAAWHCKKCCVIDTNLPGRKSLTITRRQARK